MIAASGVDTTVFAAFAVGFVSFLSPCVLPLVPGYLSAVSGVNTDALGERTAGQRARVLGPATIFCLSFTLMFVALGMSATRIGSTLSDHQETLNLIAGWTIVALGVFMIATLFVLRFNRDIRPEALIGQAVAGRSSPAWRSRSRGRPASGRRSARFWPPHQRPTPSVTVECCWRAIRLGSRCPFCSRPSRLSARRQRSAGSVATTRRSPSSPA